MESEDSSWPRDDVTHMAARESSMAQDIRDLKGRVEDIAKELVNVTVSQATMTEILTTMRNRMYGGNGHGGDIDSIDNRLDKLEQFHARVEPVVEETVPTLRSRVEGLEKFKWRWAGAMSGMVVLFEAIRFAWPYLKH